MPEHYLAKLRGIEYFTALCLLIELDRQFSPYYWTNIGDDALPFVGLIEHTNLIDPARYGGRRFLYVANYLPRGHELLELDAEGLLEAYTPGLKAVNPAFDRSLGQAAVAAPRARPPSRSSPWAIAPRFPPCRPRRAGSSWRTRPRSSRRTAGPTTRSARGNRQPTRCCRTCPN